MLRVTLSFLSWLLRSDVDDWVVRITAKIEDLDTTVSGSSNPLLLRVEGNLVGCGIGLESSGFLVQVVDIPDLDTVLFA